MDGCVLALFFLVLPHHDNVLSYFITGSGGTNNYNKECLQLLRDDMATPRKPSKKGLAPSKSNRAIHKQQVSRPSTVQSGATQYCDTQEDGDDVSKASIISFRDAIAGSQEHPRSLVIVNPSNDGQDTPLQQFLEEKKAIAENLKPRDCVTVIVGLYKKIWREKEQSRSKVADFTQRLDDIQPKLDSSKEEKASLRKKLDAALIKLRDANTNDCNVLLPVNKELTALIETKTKNILWGMVKFIQGPKEEMVAAKLLVKYADKLPEVHTASKAARSALANTYKGTIRKAIFQRRNYVAAEHKKAMLKRYKEKGSMPTVAQLIKCLQRDITNEDDFEVFEFYWDELLPKQVGSLVWSKEIRYYRTLRGACPRPSPDKFP